MAHDPNLTSFYSETNEEFLTRLTQNLEIQNMKTLTVARRMATEEDMTTLTESAKELLAFQETAEDIKRIIARVEQQIKTKRYLSRTTT